MSELLDENENTVLLQRLDDKPNLFVAIWRVHLKRRIFDNDVESGSKLGKVIARIHHFVRQTVERPMEEGGVGRISVNRKIECAHLIRAAAEGFHAPFSKFGDRACHATVIDLQELSETLAILLQQCFVEQSFVDFWVLDCPPGLTPGCGFKPVEKLVYAGSRVALIAERGEVSLRCGRKYLWGDGCHIQRDMGFMHDTSQA
ncbi:hypothetical protein N7467_003439 [Penicillium canescens]|nr:hypothetical protein N7467_003439 [Penicillium canescens]